MTLLIKLCNYNHMSDRNVQVCALAVHRAGLARTEACVPQGAGGRLGWGTRVQMPLQPYWLLRLLQGRPLPGVSLGASSRLRENLALHRACLRSLPPFYRASRLAGGRRVNTCSQCYSFLSSQEPHCPLAEGREGQGWACGKGSCYTDP